MLPVSTKPLIVLSEKSDCFLLGLCSFHVGILCGCVKLSGDVFKGFNQRMLGLILSLIFHHPVIHIQCRYVDYPLSILKPGPGREREACLAIAFRSPLNDRLWFSPHNEDSETHKYAARFCLSSVAGSAILCRLAVSLFIWRWPSDCASLKAHKPGLAFQDFLA